MTFGDWLSTLIRQVRDGMEAEPRTPVPPPPADLLAYHPDVPVGYFLYGWLEWIGMPGWKTEGAARIRALLGDLGPGALARVDEQFRRHLWIHNLASGPKWLNPAAGRDPYAVATDPAPVDALELPGELAAWGLGVLAMHPGGYVREAAVRRLAALRGGDELPFLLLRANDWTRAVRERAARAVIERAVPENAPLFVRALPLVTRLEESERKNAEPVLEAVRPVLRSPQARQALFLALDSPDRRMRRPAFALLAEGAEGDVLRAIIETGLRSGDAVVRRAAARQAARLPVADARGLLPALMANGTGMERVLGLAVAEKAGPYGEPWIRAAVSDRRSMVRATARFILKARGVTDFAAFYREALETDGAGAEGALLGLGETGSAEDAAILRRFLAHPLMRVRIAAVEALLRLRRDEAVPDVLPLLADVSPRVSRTVRAALERRPVPHADLAAVIQGAHPPYARLNALALLVRGSRWEVIRWILRAVRDDDPLVAGAGREELAYWRARHLGSAQKPLPDQLAALSVEVEAAADRIDPEMLSWLRGVAKPLG